MLGRVLQLCGLCAGLSLGLYAYAFVALDVWPDERFARSIGADATVTGQHWLLVPAASGWWWWLQAHRFGWTQKSRSKPHGKTLEMLIRNCVILGLVVGGMMAPYYAESLTLLAVFGAPVSYFVARSTWAYLEA